MTAERLVVVDVETTGFRTTDRVVEVAAVSLDARTLEVVDEFETLVNPGRGVGPTAVHGITDAMVVDAPSFRGVAAELTERLHGGVLVAHNLRFDQRMLNQEYEKFMDEPDWGTGICTYRLSGLKLAAACEAHAISLHGHHRALDDARAAAELLRRVIDPAAPMGPVSVPPMAGIAPERLLTRAQVAGR